jgi:hypothetical protein
MTVRNKLAFEECLLLFSSELFIFNKKLQFCVFYMGVKFDITLWVRHLRMESTVFWDVMYSLVEIY